MKSKGKYIPMLLLTLLLWLAWQQQWWKGPQRQPRVTAHNNTSIATTDKRDKKITEKTPAGLNRHAPLKYTRHARCRMECRHVTEAEVVGILETGSVNNEKSNPQDEPCPTYALEGYSEEGQHLRVVFAPCEDTTSVVTCIDLDKDWSCSCN
ncbi:DUF4258 domain-containing protein [Chitinophaga pinensis]|uniref:DUF4258 domain-containing protein n=1 Tax=Chitinophaga pinensis (strain ATCC 43595 / DSM 2588 / LMG 13176 / NBRC 15968 / NCIMB 11800 / UQM 2034) TaxID=485918 RepID=A0A979GZJ1_CHIPD|nr:DUF4258 domain-containing protein [Chitinophaga pinensis]ACU63981.1 hypothetical protein Cpin_6577 [Chitinophaga pinensis DSM 2588]